MLEIKQPKIRFKGHINGWEERKLGEIAKRVVRKNKNLESNLPLTISAQYGLVDQETYFNKQIASKDISNYYLLEKGEFAYNKSYSKDYPWGTIKRLDKFANGVLSTLYIVFKPVSVDSNYLVSYYDSTYWHKEVSMRASEGARNHGLLNITAKDFFDTDLKLPVDNKEQSKIGEFFKTLDNTIALHEQKLEVTKQFKQTMLKKMFPKNGETTPEIRFKGFTEDWEECKLGDFLYEVSKRGNSELEFITVREFDTILRPQSNQGYGNIVTDSKKLKAKIVLNGQFLIDLTSYSRGIYLSRLDGLTSNTYSVLELSEFGNLEFFTEFLKHPLFVSKLESSTPIGARQGKKIDQNSLLKSKFRIPHKEEQEVIGNYFKELDIQINSLEKKLFDMNLYKKTMLKKMFL